MNQIYGLSDRFVADVTVVPLCNYKASGGLFLPWSDNVRLLMKDILTLSDHLDQIICFFSFKTKQNKRGERIYLFPASHHTMLASSLLIGLAATTLAQAARVEHYWDITYTTANPDGLYERRVIGVNGTWP